MVMGLMCSYYMRQFVTLDSRTDDKKNEYDLKILGISFLTSLTQVILCSDNNARRVESKALKKWSMKYVCMVRSGFLPDESNINAKRVGFNPHFFQQQG